MLSTRSLPLLLAAVLLAAPGRAQTIRVPVSGGAGAPTAVDGVVYFVSGTSLFGVRSSDGAAMSGFPVDLQARITTGGSLTGRPSVYFGNDAKGIYVYSTRADVARVNPDGSVAWIYNAPQPADGMWDNMPIAVTPEGEVFSSINDGSGYRIIKLSQSDGSLLRTSVRLSTSKYYGTGALAVQNGLVFLSNPDSAVGGRFIVLNASDLTVRAASDSGDFPCVLGNAVFSGTNWVTHRLYKQNSITLNPDAVFGAAEGTPGSVTINEGGAGGLFPYQDASIPSGEIYVAPYQLSEPVLVVNPVTGAKRSIPLGNTGSELVKGFVVVPGVRRMAFTGSMYGFGGPFFTAYLQLSLDNPNERTYVDSIPGKDTEESGISVPAFDRTTNRFFVGASDGLYGFTAQ